MWMHFGVQLNELRRDVRRPRGARRAGGAPVAGRRTAGSASRATAASRSRRYVFAGVERRRRRALVRRLGRARRSASALASRFSTYVGAELRAAPQRHAVARELRRGRARHDALHVRAARPDDASRMTTRVNFTATPTLSFQLYAAAVREHRHVRELARAGATPRAEQLRRPLRAVRHGAIRAASTSSSSARTRCCAGSTVPAPTLFVVWQQGREAVPTRASDFDFGRDYGDLLGLHPNNTFLVKVSYWLNP